MSVSEQDVLYIAPDIQSDSSVIDAMITAAEDIITDRLGLETSISNTMKEQITKFLAAHLIYTGPERQPGQVKIDDVTETYGKLGLNLDATTYGQMAKAMDSTGKLASMGMKEAGFSAPGKISNADYD